MKSKLLCTLSLLVLLSSQAQTILQGNLYNAKDASIIGGNIVIESDSLGVIAHGFSIDKHGYVIKVEQQGSLSVTFSSLGYKTKILPLAISVDTTLTIDAFLEPIVFSLNEVVLTAESPIQQKKDTITLTVSKFTEGNEQVVEDLLKKIPGLTVDPNGVIKVDGKEIEKLLIEGDDFFSTDYQLLSKNMPAHPIEKVEVLRNFNDNALLKDIEESDKVALNLKLDEAAKNIWFGNTDLAYGLISENRYHVRTNLMNFSKENKYYLFSNLNNSGHDVLGNSRLASSNTQNHLSSETFENVQGIGPILKLSSHTLPLKKQRAHFNNVEILSLNSIFNPSERLRIAAIGSFKWDENDFFNTIIDNIRTVTTSFENIQTSRLRDKRKGGFGKLELDYTLSKTAAVKSISHYMYKRSQAVSNLDFNGASTQQELQAINEGIDQHIQYSKMLKERKALVVSGRIFMDKRPEAFRLNRFFLKELFPLATTATNLSQQSSSHTKFYGLHTHLLDRSEGGHLFEISLGGSYKKDLLVTEFKLLQDNVIVGIPQEFQNRTASQTSDIYATASYFIKLKKVALRSSVDAHYLSNTLKNDRPIHNSSRLFFNPKATVDWQISEDHSLILSYEFDTTRAEPLDVHSNFMLTSFNTFSKGTGNFQLLEHSTLHLNYQLGQWSKRLFVSTSLLYKKNHDYFSTHSFLDQNYTQIAKMVLKDRHYFSMSSKLDYYIKSLAATMKLNVNHTISSFENSIDNFGTRKVSTNNSRIGLEIRSGFRGFFNYHFGTKWTHSSVRSTNKSSFLNNFFFLDLSFDLHSQLFLNLQAERYGFGNYGERLNNYYFTDVEGRYTLKENKLALVLSAKNLFNTKRIRNVSVSDLGTTTTQYRLLPRFLLLKIEYRF